MKIIDTTNFDYTDFEDEIVLVNVNKGVYYSLLNDAPIIFRLFLKGYEIEYLKSKLISTFGEIHLNLLNEFLDVLIKQQILIDVESSNTVDVSNQISFDMLSKKPKYTIEIQDDISDLIKLDPIHDVSSEQGWPKKSQGN